MEVFVLRDLGPDHMVMDTSRMGALDGIQDCEAGTLSFHNSNVSVKATHKRRTSKVTLCVGDMTQFSLSG